MLRLFNKNNSRNIIFAVVFSVILFSILGCKTILLKVVYGYHKPRIENKESILKFANKKKLIKDNIFSFSENDWYWAIKDAKFAKDIPEILVFDKNGRMIKYREENQCNAQAFTFISSLDTAKKYNYDSLLTLEKLTSKLRDLDGNFSNFIIEQPTDFYIFIFWSLWTGKLNKDHVKIWEEEAINNKGCKINIIKVNMDSQEWWTKH